MTRLLPALLLLATACLARPATIRIRDSTILIDNSPFVIKGVHYGPWRPGTGPNKGYPYPSPDEVESDLRLIRSLNANSILVADAPDYVLDLAAKYGLRVLYCIFVQWWTIGEKDSSVPAEVLAHVRQLKNKEALMGWVLGNEVPPLVIQTRGSRIIETGLEDLYHQVKTADSAHPVTHSNWPVTKDLRLGFLDFISFNVYPLWPPEVVAQGYENYLRSALKPLAAGKPLLISEFGVDSLEAGETGQGRLLKQSWQQLRDAGACGGMVFEFADEWWKNYDNPRLPGAYWDRQAAPDDEKTHDRDPEEYYGIFTAERQRKSAATVVAEMFSEKPVDVPKSRTVPGLVISTIIVSAACAWLVGSRRARSRLH